MKMKICKKCQKEFPYRFKTKDGKNHIVNKRIFCFDCSPFGKHNTQDLTSPSVCFEKDGKIYKKCPSCQKILELNNENYYIRKNKNCKDKFHYYCKICQDNKTLELQRQRKKEAVLYKGGKCIFCGYNKYFGALDFHHTDPLKKDFGIGSLRYYNFEKIKKELDKCILVCSNCHREIHGELIKVSNIV